MRKHLLILLLLSLLLSNCNGQTISEVLNGTATASATSTQTPLPTSTHTPQPTTTPVITEISIPDGFIEKDIAQLGLSVWMPENWFYHYEEQGNTSAIFVTKESIEEYGRFSTGLSVNILSEIDEPAVIVNNFIDSILMAETTKNIISQDNRYLGDNEDVLFRACYIAAEIEIDPNDPNPSREKTIIYMAIADTDHKKVYLVFFESPSSEWQDAWLNDGVYITQSIIESIDNNLLLLSNN